MITDGLRALRLRGTGCSAHRLVPAVRWAMFRAYAEAGATWWLEHLHGRRGAYEELLARVEAGPPP